MSLDFKPISSEEFLQIPDDDMIMDVEIIGTIIRVETVSTDFSYSTEIWAPKLLPLCGVMKDLRMLCWTTKYEKVQEPLDGIDFNYHNQSDAVFPLTKDYEARLVAQPGRRIYDRPKIDGIRVRYTHIGNKAYIVQAKSGEYKAFPINPEIAAAFTLPKVCFVECELVHYEEPGHARAASIWAKDTHPSCRRLFSLFTNTMYMWEASFDVTKTYTYINAQFSEGIVRYILEADNKIVAMHKYKNYVRFEVPVIGTSTTKTGATQLICHLGGSNRSVQLLGSRGPKNCDFALVRARQNARGEYEEMYALSCRSV